jgi:nicotinamidase-related amidase
LINQFSKDSCLLLIDVQKGVDVLSHWGGENGRRNNLEAESNMLALLSEWRQAELSVAWTLHDSLEAASPLKLSEPGGELKPGFEIGSNDIVVKKDVNSGFVGTSLEILLRRAGIQRLVVVGFFTNFCVETTIRMSGNLGFDTYLVPDCCATTNRVGPDGTDYDPDLVHSLTVANLHGEFCTALKISQALNLVTDDLTDADRCQGNE